MIQVQINVESALFEDVQKCIHSQNRLEELVVITLPNSNDSLPSGAIHIFEKQIFLSPCWNNEAPPLFLNKPWNFTPVNLLALVFARLGNFEKTYELLANDTEKKLWAEQLNKLQNHLPVSNERIDVCIRASDNYFEMHNACIYIHYGQSYDQFSIEKLCNQYEQTLLLTSEPALAAYTTYHYASLLADIGMGKDAENYINRQLTVKQSEVAKHAFQTLLCSIWLEQLQVPYDQNKVEAVKKLMWENLLYLEKNEQKIPLALLWMDAAHIANIAESFAESLGYITKSIQILENEEQPELLAQAQLKKGILLYTWSQNGQPQFLKGAMDALLAALRVFTREAAPDVFADIHHYLGIIYSEIPDETKKKSLWAAVSSASFQEALHFYNKIDYPYEFGMICHHQGNAFMKYPAALHSDNYDKALAWFTEALEIRTAEKYPIERCNTLSNYLQAAWLVGNQNTELPEERWMDIFSKATELMHLTNNEALRSEAAEQLEQLKIVRKNWNPHHA